MPFTLSSLVPLILTLKEVCLGLVELAFPDSRPSVRDDYRTAVHGQDQPSAITNQQTQMWAHLFKVKHSCSRKPVNDSRSCSDIQRCGSKDERSLTAAEVRFMRWTAGYSLLEHRRNEGILKELNIDPIVSYIQQYRTQWGGGTTTGWEDGPWHNA
jgi:hypothetical protein